MTTERRVPTRSALVVTAAALTTVLVAAMGSTGSAGAPVVSAAAPDSDPRPNIVLITTDDMAASDLARMPSVRSLLTQRGTSFARAFAPFSLCCPNRVSMLTGQYAHNHGVLGNGSGGYPLGGYEGFTTDGNTVASWLHDAGYQTAYVGKYLNGYGTVTAPARVPAGWDEWRVSRGSHYTWTKMFEDGVDRIYENTYLPHLFTSKARSIIERRMPAGGPLFLWLSYQAPHAGLPTDRDDCINTHGRNITSPSPAPGDRNRFAGVALPRGPAFNEADVSDKPQAIRSLPRLSDVAITCLTEVHRQRLESLQSVDRGVAAMVAAVQAAGELANTVFVFTSDNGYLLGHHRVQQGKVLPYEPSIRVPLVIRGPGFPPGTTRPQLVGSHDLASTFVDLANGTARRAADGTSLLPLAGNAQTMAGRDIVIEAGPQTVNGPMYFTGLRTGRYTYVEYATGERELYDLNQDPDQLQNVAGNAGYAAIQSTLAAELDRVRDCSGPACLVQTPH